MDARIKNVARTLVRYCVRAQKGRSVGVTGGTAAEPLLVAVYEELIRVGAFPVMRMTPDALSEILFSQGKSHHFTTLTPFQKAFGRCMDATIRIQSQTNTRALSRTNPSRHALMAATLKPVADRLRKKPWVLTLFPTEAYAQDAEMSLRDFEDFVYGAMFADEPDPVAAWKALKKRQDRLIARLKGAHDIHIVGPETNLKLSVTNRTFVNSDGRRNMPSGEVFTGPLERSADGHIEFDYPVCRSGREIDGIRLVFRKGKVVEAHARKNDGFLHKMLAMDAGASRLGELGIGTNTRIQKFTKNILFDEKIGGTIHLALGQSYPETGGRNKSALHWDMIKDLRRGGALYVDGKALLKDGKLPN